jgi:hypothetical protein
VSSLDTVYGIISRQGTHGCTWKEIAEELGIHHGQASGALSNLHKLERVFTVHGYKRKGCSVYVTDIWRGSWHRAERMDEPVQTKAKRDRILLDAVLDSAWQVVDSGGAPMDLLLLEQALQTYGKENQ